MKNKLLSAALAAVLTLSCCTVPAVTADAAQTDSDAAVSSQFAQDSIRGAAVLHCFNWSYNEIKRNLPEIAKAGYTAVQTSPVQQPKSYKASYTEMSGQWWKLYQPLTLSIADGGTWLGTKAEQPKATTSRSLSTSSRTTSPTSRRAAPTRTSAPTSRATCRTRTTTTPRPTPPLTATATQ